MITIDKEAGSAPVRKTKGKVKVCRIEYETNDRTNWKAVVLAYSIEEAIQYIRKKVPAFSKYISTGVVAEVDAVDDVVYDDLFVSKTTVVETVVSNTDDDSEDKQLSCPWCEKPFLNKITLGNHIKRFHMDSK